MKNKTIAMAGALLLGGILTFNGIAFADTAQPVDSTSAATVNKVPLQKGQLHPGKPDAPNKKGGIKMQKEFMHKQDWSTQLKALVAAGTINQATADKIQAYINQQEAAMKAEMEKLQVMTPEQRKAYFDSKKSEAPKKLDLFSSMVERGVLTQQQADAIESKLHAIQQEKQKEGLKASLTPLVTNNTITEGQLTQILSYLDKQQAARAAEMEKIRSMTQEERNAYFKSNPPTKVNILSQLVTDKVLTQEQADAVQNAMHPQGFNKGHKQDFNHKATPKTPNV